MSGNLNSLLGVKTAPSKTYSDLTQDEKIIETARIRTNAFTKAIDAYYKDAFELGTENFDGTGLPGWNSINAGTLNFISQVKAFSDFVDPRPGDELALERSGIPSDVRRKFLEETSVYPDKKFPYLKGYGNDFTLYELLRRKPELAVTAWEQRMQAVGKELEDGVVVDGKKATEQDWTELWNWAAFTGVEMMQAQMDEGDEYEEDEPGEEEDGDQVMTDAKGKGVETAAMQPAMPLEYVLAYVSSGYVPPPPPPKDVKGAR